MIYWKVVFGHRKGSGVYRVHTEVPEGLPEPPRERYGPYGPKEGTYQPTRGLVRPLPCLANPREGKRGGLAPPAFSLSWEKGKGGRHPPLPFPALQIRKGGHDGGLKLRRYFPKEEGMMQHSSGRYFPQL